MKKHMKLIALVLCLSIAAALLVACHNTSPPVSTGGSTEASGGASNETEGDPIKIGFFAPLTGNSMQYGVSFQNAITLKVNEVNANGGINGRPIQIVTYDDKGDPKESVNVANLIISDPDIKAVIGSFSSSCSMAAAPVFEEAGILHLAGTASHPDFVFMGDYMFTIAMTMKFEASADAEYAFEKTGGTDMALIYLNSDYGISHAEVFRDRYEELGGKMVAYETFIPGDTKDFTPIVTKVKEANPGALFVVADYTDGAQIFKQAQKLDLDCDLIGPGMLIKDEFISVAGDAVAGLLMLSTLPIYSEEDVNNEDPNKAKFVSEYYEAYNIIPDGFPANAYDSVSILIDIIGDVGYDADAMSTAFRNLGRYEGVSGNITLDPDTKEVKRDLLVYTIVDGRYVIEAVVSPSEE